MYGDPQAIRRLAHEMRLRAGDIRAEGRAVGAAEEATVWTGCSAATLRAVTRERLDALTTTARLHEAAADDLDRHAATVARLLELIDAAERAFRRLVHEAADWLAELPFVPPPLGHRDWLGVRLPDWSW